MNLLNKIFETTLIHSSNSKLIIIPGLFLEYIPIYYQTLYSLDQLVNESLLVQNASDYNFLNFFNSLALLKSFRSPTTIGSSVYKCFSTASIFIYLSTLVLFLILYSSCQCLSEMMNVRENLLKGNQSGSFKYFFYFFANLWELIFSHFSICTFYVIFNSIFSSVNFYIQNGGSSYFILILYSSIFFLFFTWISYRQIQSLSLIVHFDSDISYYNDSKFSTKIRYLLLFLKIIISIENNFSLLPLQKLKLISFLSIMIITAIPIALCIILFTVVLRKDSLFLINNVYNSFRLFLISSNAIFILSFLCFDQDKNSIVLMIFNIIGNILIALTISTSLIKNNKSNIFQSGNLIHQMSFLFNKSIISRSIEQDISDLLFIHKFNCRSRYESVNDCKICKEKIITSENIFKVYLKCIKYKLKKDKLFFVKEDILCLKLVKLFTHARKNKKESMKLIFKANSLIKKFKTDNCSLFTNLSIFFNEMHSDNINLNFTQNYRMLKNVDEMTSNIDNSLKTLSFFLLDNDIVQNKEIYPTAKSLSEKKRKILKNLQYLKKSKLATLENKFFIQNFQIVVTFIYETLYNSKLRSDMTVSDFIFDFEEFFYENYKNHKNLHILYETEKKSLKIINAGKEFNNFIGKNLEEIFHPQFRKDAKDKFISQIVKNKQCMFQFDYIINFAFERESGLTLSQEDNLFNLRLEAKIYPSLNLDEIMIVANYSIFKTDIMILEINEENRLVNNISSKQENKKIINFSENISKILFISPKMIKNLQENFYFSDIFHIKKDENTEKNNKQIYQLNYDSYFLYCQKLLKCFENQDEDQNFLELIKLNLGQVLNFKLVYLYSINSNNGKTFEVHCLKNVRHKKQNNNDINESENNFHDEESFEFKNFIQIQSSTITSSSSIITQADPTLKLKSGHDFEVISKNTNILKKFTLFTFLYNMGLVIYCIIIIVLGVSNSFTINMTYKMYWDYSNLQRTYYHITMSLFNNFGLDYQNATNLNNLYYNIYYGYNQDIKVSLRDYINLEALEKLDVFMEIILTLQQNLLTYKGHYGTEFFDKKIPIYDLSVVGDKMTVKTSETYFFESMRIFINKFTQIFQSQLESIPIKIIPIVNNEVDFSFVDVKNLSGLDVSCYEVIVNYPYFLKNLEYFGSIITTSNDDIISKIFQQTSYFSFILIGLHILSLLIYYLIISNFYKFVNEDLRIINNYSTTENLKQLMTKLENLSNFNKFFIESPKKIMKKLKPKHIPGHKAKNQRNLDKQKDRDKSKKSLKNKYYLNIKKLILPLIKLIAVMFSFYFVYFLVFYCLIQGSENELVINTTTFRIISEKDSKVYTDKNLLQIMMLTNTSDADMYMRINGIGNSESAGNYGYLMSSIRSSFKEEDTIQIWEKSDKDFKIIADTSTQLMDCNYIYTQTNDTFIINTIDKYFPNKKEQVLNSLINICSKFDFMASNDINLIFNNFIYTLQKILSLYETSDRSYYSIYKTYNNFKFFDLSIIGIIIARPIQFALTTSTLLPILDSSLGYYITLLILYLVLNVIIDTIIVIVIKKKVIGRILQVNAELNTFIDIFKN